MERRRTCEVWKTLLQTEVVHVSQETRKWKAQKAGSTERETKEALPGTRRKAAYLLVQDRDDQISLGQVL